VEPESAAAAFVLTEPADRTRELIGLLETGMIDPGSSRVRVTQRVVLGGASVDNAMSLLRAWRSESEGAARLGRTLRSLLEVKQAAEQRCTHAELVWTGHKPPGSPLRSTPPVLSEMLDAAKTHVIILSYSVWLGQARVRAVLDRLVAARRRGTRVTFVIDRKYNPGGIAPDHNRRQLRTSWPADAPQPDVYSWGDDDDEIAKLHAKVMVVDRRDLLVTSANLTRHGMSGNLELGVRLIGRPAEQAHDHVLDLITRGTFTPEKPW
jgi:phosphatidylserine/phosphatidylglycerophosphate/cardiolipin synthase-like enzyme